MSPELLYPERFGAKDSKPTTHSDCYALGMVVYEVRGHLLTFDVWNNRGRLGSTGQKTVLGDGGEYGG